MLRISFLAHLSCFYDVLVVRKVSCISARRVENICFLGPLCCCVYKNKSFNKFKMYKQHKRWRNSKRYRKPQLKCFLNISRNFSFSFQFLFVSNHSIQQFLLTNWDFIYLGVSAGISSSSDQFSSLVLEFFKCKETNHSFHLNNRKYMVIVGKLLFQFLPFFQIIFFYFTFKVDFHSLILLNVIFYLNWIVFWQRWIEMGSVRWWGNTF